MAWDENGGIYVAEMLDYPFDPEEGEEPRSRIRFLEDTDGDGVVDESTIFADKLLQVTSVLPWNGGILATAAPQILFLKDTNGDHRADVREVLFTGFQSHEVSPESRITNLRWGIDNWVYAANNGRPGNITSPQDPSKPPVVVRGYDFRFKPGENLWEPAAGPTQFGMSFDEWGNRYMSQNTVHLRHAVVPARYIMRNRYYAPDSMLQYLPEDDPRNSVVYPLTEPQQWRRERTDIRQERYDETRPGRVELVGGHFTAATGATAYTGDAFPANFKNNLFIADANGNLLHRDILHPAGATFRAERWPDDREFLASTDVWFRPVNFANAPDGNLYVLDFYREYIEEPASIPKAIQERLQLDFYRGDDRGRIWRIAPENGSAQGSLLPALGSASDADLVATLEHPNAWYRTTAQRLLLERKASGSVSALEQLLAESANPLTRLHALWTLEGLGALHSEHVRAALGDSHAGIRTHGLRLAESFLPEVEPDIVALADDADPKVRFQVALTVGYMDAATPLISRMAAREVADEWMRIALLSSCGDNASDVIDDLLRNHRSFFASPDAAHTEFLSQLAAMVGAQREAPAVSRLLQQLQRQSALRLAAWRAPLLRGLADGLSVSGERGLRLPTAGSAVAQLLRDDEPAVRQALRESAQYLYLPGLVARSKRDALDADLDVESRSLAVRSLRGGEFEDVRPVLAEILRTPAPQAVQAAAASTLSVFEDPAVAEILLEHWRGYGPDVRQAAVAALLEFPARTEALLSAVESGSITPSSIDAVDRIRIAQFPDDAIQARAREMFATQTSDRAEVVATYEDVLDLQASAAAGKQPFEDHCAKCHLSRGKRGRIGPDLSGVNNKTAGELLTHILDPSFEIQPNYTNYLVTDDSGRMYDGLLAGETAHTLRLRGELEDITLARESIREIRASTVSLMPDGLEEDMTRQELADVIAYLRAGL